MRTWVWIELVQSNHIFGDMLDGLMQYLLTSDAVHVHNEHKNKVQISAIYFATQNIWYHYRHNSLASDSPGSEYILSTSIRCPFDTLEAGSMFN